jgi:transketolase
VIKSEIPAVFMEAAQGDLWYRLMPKSGGEVIGINHFGESAPANELYTEFGLTVENVQQKAKQLVKKTTKVSC